MPIRSGPVVHSAVYQTIGGVLQVTNARTSAAAPDDVTTGSALGCVSAKLEPARTSTAGKRSFQSGLGRGLACRARPIVATGKPKMCQ